MTLLALDLDDTIVDRSAAFETWAAAFVESLRGGTGDLEWLVDSDLDGDACRSCLAWRIKERFSLSETFSDVLERLLFDYIRCIRPTPGAADGLRLAREEGHRVVVITNGIATQQRMKLAVSQLDTLIDAIVISEECGFSKPSRRIFTIAAEACAEGVAGSYMIGDNPITDIYGGKTAGMDAIWIRRGREWDGLHSPEFECDSAGEALEWILAAGQPVAEYD